MMNGQLTQTIRDVVEEISSSFFPPEFKIFAGHAVETGDGEPSTRPLADVTAVVGFSGDIEGGLHLSAPTSVALKLTGAFTGENFSEIDETVTDAIGELANIIGGAVKGKLAEEMGRHIELSPPMVVTGSDFDVTYNTSLNSAKQYFMQEKGPFFVEVFY